MADYITTAELKRWLNVHDAADDETIGAAVSAASRHIDAYCGRTFSPTPTVLARSFHASDRHRLRLPSGADIATVDGLVVETDDDDDATFETTWTIGTDFEVGPERGYDGADGWPFQTIDAVGSKCWPVLSRRSVQITAKWGWLAVPEQVQIATYIHAADLWKLKDSPFGVAGFGEYGVVRVGQNRRAAELLDRFRHGSITAVIA